MTEAASLTSTEVPTLRVVADLGETPPLADVANYLRLLRHLCDTAAFMVDPTNESRHYLIEGAQYRRTRDPGGFAVARLSLASPLETILVTVAQDMKPVAYAVAAMAAVK
ncbi:hypothetical protein D7147_04800 [Micromonospora musae]|uniref:Uncharacterized protein n=1 Tax=Micromonospora musae TaxID=1894970 RepID=A0ABX9RG01_9ACTN|nr:hypothetical protein [Micromonospora musae]RKN22059.1 hypothetical protein D7147_04800 [Micromonospora musae]